jgi:hypothetical protein
MSSLKQRRVDGLESPPRPIPDTVLPPLPPTGFWATSMSVTGVLKQAAIYELYAAVAGLAIALGFSYQVLFRLSLGAIPRLILVLSSPVYFSILLSANAAVLAVLSTARRNLSGLESALARVADAITSPVLRALPAARISIDDLRTRLLNSSESVKAAEAGSGGGSGGCGPIGVASSLMLKTAVRTVLYALEKRYAGVLRDGNRMISCQTVKVALSGELVSVLMSPFSSSLSLYTALVFAETVSLSASPFILAWLLSGTHAPPPLPRHS